MRETGRSAAWTLPLCLILFAIVFVPLQILEPEGLPRYRALRAELIETRRSNARKRRELVELQAKVVRLRSDAAAIERVARDELGMLRSGEIVFQFEE